VPGQKQDKAMLKLGASPSQTREMDLDDIFHSRLLLLIHMVSHCLDENPLSDLRRRVMLTNAQHILSESIELGGLDTPLANTRASYMDEITERPFYCLTRDLAMQAISVSREYAMENSLRKTIRENIAAINQRLSKISRTSRRA
jgi:hypothetical protein